MWVSCDDVLTVFDCLLHCLQEIIASFSFQSKVNLSAIKRIYSSLLWHFEQVHHSKSIISSQTALHVQWCVPNKAVGLAG
jgi:hypothetical protein